MYIFDINGQEINWTRKGHVSYITDIEWSPDGKMLASCGLDGYIKFWGPIPKDEINIPIPLLAVGGVVGLAVVVFYRLSKKQEDKVAEPAD